MIADFTALHEPLGRAMPTAKGPLGDARSLLLKMEDDVRQHEK
jgi:hypothetical protein